MNPWLLAAGAAAVAVAASRQRGASDAPPAASGADVLDRLGAYLASTEDPDPEVIASILAELPVGSGLAGDVSSLLAAYAPALLANPYVAAALVALDPDARGELIDAAGDLVEGALEAFGADFDGGPSVAIDALGYGWPFELGRTVRADGYSAVTNEREPFDISVIPAMWQSMRGDWAEISRDFAEASGNSRAALTFGLRWSPSGDLFVGFYYWLSNKGGVGGDDWYAPAMRPKTLISGHRGRPTPPIMRPAGWTPNAKDPSSTGVFDWREDAARRPGDNVAEVLLVAPLPDPRAGAPSSRSPFGVGAHGDPLRAGEARQPWWETYRDGFQPGLNTTGRVGRGSGSGDFTTQVMMLGDDLLAWWSFVTLPRGQTTPGIVATRATRAPTPVATPARRELPQSYGDGFFSEDIR